VLIQDANILCENTYTVNENEIQVLNEFLVNHNEAFEILHKVIDSFTYSYKLSYDAKAFEQIITTLEILFLNKGESMKTENLSKRVAVFLEDDDVKILELYKEIRSFYKYRSKSTHEGIDLKITRNALVSLKEYTRRSIKKFIDVIEEDLLINSLCNFHSIKINIILQLKQDIIVKIQTGILPERAK